MTPKRDISNKARVAIFTAPVWAPVALLALGRIAWGLAGAEWDWAVAKWWSPGIGVPVGVGVGIATSKFGLPDFGSPAKRKGSK